MSTTTASLVASATSAAAAASASAASHSQSGGNKVVGVLLAVGSGLLIGSSFVFKKKGLLAAQRKANMAAGEGVPYLKSWLWWCGMIIMVVGELMNLIAYSFTDAILVTPMGSIAVVTSGALAHFFLGEKLTLFGWLGSTLCILGSIVIAVNGPSERGSTTIQAFQTKFVSVGFLVWGGICIAAALGIIFFVAPRYGKRTMLVYITICSLLGGLSVACTSGLGGAILTSIKGDGSQWKHWYFLLAFCVVTLLSEIVYLNKALALFNTASVTPVYFTIFTSCTLITSIILNKGFGGASVAAIITVVLGFLVIVVGISLLQLSKIDPEEIKDGVLDRRSTILLSVSRAEKDTSSEKAFGVEDPGIDAIRGVAGALGSIHRAISMRSGRGTQSRRTTGSSLANPFADEEMVMRRRGRNGAPGAMGSGPHAVGEDGVLRYELYDQPMQFADEPMPLDAADKISLHSSLKSPSLEAGGRSRSASAIQFAETDEVHRYAPPKRKGKDVVAQHHEQPRLEGSHVHVPHTLSTGDIASPGLPPSRFSSSTVTPDRAEFSAARSGSVFANSAYVDPYNEAEQGHRSASPPLGSATSPRRQGTSDSGSRSLAERLGSVFGSSSPDLKSGEFVQQSHDPPPSASRSRFALSPFRRNTPQDHEQDSSIAKDHRVPYPKAAKGDIEARGEEEALVPGRGRSGSVSSDEEGADLETVDTRDEL
ncbi:DUF803 domain membrane protein [Rhodotorula toruloides]|uniref:DUF803 domain membrane protein n=1 Tax=Rhodotorula toruloides TaxID=5286 RepID=A0A511KC33_RHOTO|nr:DUF803 domain membrane protein [Rhodotorula toruloides]